MLVGLVCSCSGSESLVRQAFRRAGLENWLNVPVIVGKDKCLSFLNGLTEYSDMVAYRALIDSIMSRGRFSTIVGFSGEGDEREFRWGNVNNATAQEQLDAEVIATRFAS